MPKNNVIDGYESLFVELTLDNAEERHIKRRVRAELIKRGNLPVITKVISNSHLIGVDKRYSFLKLGDNYETF